MNPIPGMVFDPVTLSYRPKAEADAYMAIQRVHEANMEKQEFEGYQTFPKPPLGENMDPLDGGKVCQCGSRLTKAEEKYYGHNCERCEEKDYQSLQEDCDSGGQAQPEPLTTRNLKHDCHQAIEQLFTWREFLNTVHPDVRKIINFGELLNERI